MKSKKLLISLLIVAAIVVLIVVLAAIFTVREVVPVYHNFEGSTISAPADGIAPIELTDACKGKSILFLSKSKLTDELNANYPQWAVVQIVKQFPDTVEVHFYRRKTFAKLQISDATTVYVDNAGYVTDEPADKSLIIDITSAFQNKDIEGQTAVAGKPLRFVSEENNTRLHNTLQALVAVWRCWVEPEQISEVLGERDVFRFDEDGDLVITPKLKGKIVVESPSSGDPDLVDRLIKALGVYYNGQINLHSDDYTITVTKNGSVQTNNKQASD